MKGEINEETWNAVKEAQEEYWRIMVDPEMSAIAELREKSIMDRKFAMSHARKEEKIEIAKKMKQINMSIEEIEEATGLTKDEIEKL